MTVHYGVAYLRLLLLYEKNKRNKIERNKTYLFALVPLGINAGCRNSKVLGSTAS